MNDLELMDKEKECEHCENTVLPGGDLAENEFSNSAEEAEMNTFSHEGQVEDPLPLQGKGDSSDEVSADPAKHSIHRQHLEKFLKELEALPDHEAKLQYAIDFMEASLAQSGTPHFKSFWEARNICLQLFKENISPALRTILWAKYNELSKEARRLKEILDEQSAFAVEQIEIAIKALEVDIASMKEHLGKSPLVDFGISTVALASHLQRYQELQRELSLLNTHASRINALRKELIRTEMRVRQKNKFFQRLSSAGDSIFPHRKELIKEVSQYFIEDIDGFIEKYFKNDFHDSLFTLREEIKALQNMAKVLTLNTHAFTHTRMRLSECWDRIKNEEKERKKERAHQKAQFKQNFDDAMQKVRAFTESYQTQPTSIGEATKKLDEVVAHIKTLDLGRDEWRILREELNAARKPILEKIHSEEMHRQQQSQEREQQRRNKYLEIKNQIDELLKNHPQMSSDELASRRDAVLDMCNELSLNKAEKQEIERQLKPLRDIISEKKESSLLSLSDNDRQSLQQLKTVLQQRKERRQEIKDQIDALRKSGGSSGLDFEQAMNYNAQIEMEKERLEKINQGIKEVEQKIAQLSKR